MKIVIFASGDAQYIFAQKINRLLSKEHKVELYSPVSTTANISNDQTSRYSIIFKFSKHILNTFGELFFELYLIFFFLSSKSKNFLFRRNFEFTSKISSQLISSFHKETFAGRFRYIILMLSPSYRAAANNFKLGLEFQMYLRTTLPDRVIFVEENIFDSSLFAHKFATQMSIDTYVIQYSSGIPAELSNYLFYETTNFSRLHRFIIRNLMPEFHQKYRDLKIYFPLYVPIQSFFSGVTLSQPFSGYFGGSTMYLADNESDFQDMVPVTAGSSQVYLVEPIDVTYSRIFNSHKSSPRVAVLLPPDQFFNTKNLNSEFTSYDNLLKFIFSSFKLSFGDLRNTYFHLHPRSRNHLQALQEQFPDFNITETNYVESLENICFAVIFGSATFKVFGYLGIKTLNFGIYGFEYHEVFENCGFSNHKYVRSAADFQDSLRNYEFDVDSLRRKMNYLEYRSVSDFFL